MKIAVRNIILLLTIFCFLNVAVAYALSPTYYFKHYNINNGLSQNTVYSIFQDKQGFMWFGTKDGLNRFDGNSFKTFRFPPNGELRDNVFRRILQTTDENLWVATDQGVYIYNPRKETFNRFEKQTNQRETIEGTVSDMITDNDGDVWISVEEKGVFHYDIVADKLYFYKISEKSKGLNLLTLCAGKNGDVWVFPYSRPFLHIDKKTRKISDFQLNDNKNLMYQVGEVSSVLINQFNELILATSQMGLISVNIVSKTHKILLNKDTYGESVFARSLQQVNDKTLWVGTESGIYIYNLENGQYTNLRHNKFIAHSLSDNAIYSIYKDRQNGIWIGTYFGGVNYYPNQNSGFEIFYSLDNFNSLSGNRVREFCKASGGKLWIGTEDNGLNLFDPVSASFLPVNPKLKNLYTNIHALYNDNHHLWISTFSKGLHKYNLKTNEIVTYTEFDNPKTIAQNSVFALCRDSQDKLWIGTLSGVSVYDYATNTFSFVKELNGVSVQDIEEDSDGNIYVATFHKGLFLYNPKTKNWHHFLHIATSANSLAYNKTTSIFEDSKKRIWITTEGGGFSLFNKETNTFNSFNSLNGLANDVVYQIQEDSEGHLWLSTNAGIVKFNPETKIFNNYTISNGLKTNQFNYKSSYKEENGMLYFGSVDGFVRFHPSYFKDTENSPMFVFTNLLINNYSVDISSKKSPLSESIQYAETIKLPYNKNSIALEYALLDYSGLNVKNLIYKLEGFDKMWQKSLNNNILYTNLPYGDYKLLVAFEQGDAKNNAVIKTLNISIERPFWLTWWAYFVYFLIVSSLIWILVSYVHRKSEKKQKQKMKIFQQDKEQELYKSKIDFFTNIAHEIRTPLSLIKAPLENVLKEKSLPYEVVENLTIMDKNTDRLLNLANQLLDFRKTESDLYALDLKVYNISQLVRETTSRFASFAEQQQVSLEVFLPENDVFAQIDKEAFTKIISNLISNSLKYGETYSKITLSLANENEKTFKFTTENDGAVVLDKYVKDIFKSFVQIDRNQTKIVNGTGIGLALAKSLTELLKGSITYSNETQTNLFTLILPIGNISQENGNVSMPDKETNKKKDAKRPVLLLVEDDFEMREFLSKYFESEYVILSASNGKEALEVLKISSVDIIISDIMMPEMDGFELTKHIKSNVENSHIPIILLTAKTNNQSKIKGYEMGADAYIEKPFSTEVLNARIKALLQNRKHLQEAFMKNPLIGATSVAVNKSDKEFIKKLDSVVQQHLVNPNFNVEDIAEEFFMSRASFYRKIKGTLDLTPNEYIRAERLRKAALLLKEKNYKINEICYMVGFSSPSYFTKCFHQQFGMLPKEFSESDSNV